MIKSATKLKFKAIINGEPQKRLFRQYSCIAVIDKEEPDNSIVGYIAGANRQLVLEYDKYFMDSDMAPRVHLYKSEAQKMAKTINAFIEKNKDCEPEDIAAFIASKVS